MSAERDWGRLMEEANEQPIQLKIKTGLNFNLISDDEFLIVKNSELAPSTKLKMQRKIQKENFIKVYPYFERKKSNEFGLSKEMLKNTVNSVYIFAAIEYSLHPD
ncbi:hypothetical protein [Psychrobacillus sp. L3]|uniref:hypothetical protein n=1 Tax=Psychrobacillus sp. L3 TaxID=3236891 RepID=UPI0036F25719